MKYHFMSTRMTRIKKISIDEDVEKLKSSCIAGGNTKWYVWPLWESLVVF